MHTDVAYWVRLHGNLFTETRFFIVNWTSISEYKLRSHVVKSILHWWKFRIHVNEVTSKMFTFLYNILIQSLKRISFNSTYFLGIFFFCNLVIIFWKCTKNFLSDLDFTGCINDLFKKVVRVDVITQVRVRTEEAKLVKNMLYFPLVQDYLGALILQYLYCIILQYLFVHRK